MTATEVSQGDAAALCGVSRQMIFELARQGVMRTRCEGRLVLCNLEDLEAYRHAKVMRGMRHARSGS